MNQLSLNWAPKEDMLPKSCLKLNCLLVLTVQISNHSFIGIHPEQTLNSQELYDRQQTFHWNHPETVDAFFFFFLKQVLSRMKCNAWLQLLGSRDPFVSPSPVGRTIGVSLWFFLQRSGSCYGAQASLELLDTKWSSQSVGIAGLSHHSQPVSIFELATLAFNRSMLSQGLF